MRAGLARHAGHATGTASSRDADAGRPRRPGPAGFLLLPVSLLLAVIGALSYMLVQDIGSAARPGGREAERARLVAEAGLAHATWKLNQVNGCSGYSPLAATPFGSDGDQYQVAFSATSGSPLTLTATSTLASGLAGSRASIRRTEYKTSGNTLTYTLSTDSRGSDTHLDANKPDKNYGGSTAMTLVQGMSHPVLQFDLSLIPVGSRIIEEIENSPRADAPARVTAFLRGVREAMDQQGEAR